MNISTRSRNGSWGEDLQYKGMNSLSACINQRKVIAVQNTFKITVKKSSFLTPSNQNTFHVQFSQDELNS